MGLPGGAVMSRCLASLTFCFANYDSQSLWMVVSGMVARFMASIPDKTPGFGEKRSLETRRAIVK